jgi:hypothetical protein
MLTVFINSTTISHQLAARVVCTFDSLVECESCCEQCDVRTSNTLGYGDLGVA